MFRSKTLPPPSEKAKILIVDDQPDNLELLSVICSFQGYEVTLSDRGRLAIELAKQELPHLILLDISMPEMDGYTVCQILKSDSNTKDIPIIFISVLKEIENKTQAFQFGGNDYITKPFQIEDVLLRVETQLKFYNVQTELKQKNQQLAKEIQDRQAAETKLLKLNHKLSKLATLDSLTNIANRHYFDEMLNKEWQRGQIESSPLGLILCDIDYFKKYNDCLGHQAGDDCLRRVAQAISQTVRHSGDLAARYGGEEFAVILPQTSPKNALCVAENIRLQIQRLDIPHPNSAVSDRVSLSLGISCVVPNSETTKEELLATADTALYKAKNAGRDRSILEALSVD